MEAEAFDDSFAPCIAAIRLRSTEAEPEGVEFGLGFRAVDALSPIAWTFDGPFGQEELGLRVAAMRSPCARPSPRLGLLGQVGPHGVSLDIPQDDVEVFVGFNRK